MASAFVQSTPTFTVSAGLSVTSATITTTANNDGILSLSTFQASGSSVPTFTDSNGNTPCTINADIADAANNPGRTSIGDVRLAIAGAAHSWTVTWPATVYAAGYISEFSGLDTAPIDQTATAIVGIAATSITVTTASTTQANELVIVVCAYDNGAPTDPPPGGYTSLGAFFNPAGTSAEAAYQIVSASGIQSATWTLATGGFGGAAAATYKIARVVTVQPSDVAVAFGATAAFSITADSISTYQWQDDRAGLFANCPDGTGATTASYTTASTDVVNRRFRCVLDGVLASNAANRAGLMGFAWMH